MSIIYQIIMKFIRIEQIYQLKLSEEDDAKLYSEKEILENGK